LSKTEKIKDEINFLKDKELNFKQLRLKIKKKSFDLKKNNKYICKIEVVKTFNF